VFELVFHDEAEAEILALDKVMQSKTLNALDLLRDRGSQLRYPHSRPIHDGLFELRVGNKDITRTFFAFAKERRIYILRTFIKKTLRTPLAEIELAFKRLEEMIHEKS